jgi:hypothetical protein
VNPTILNEFNGKLSWNLQLCSVLNNQLLGW